MSPCRSGSSSFRAISKTVLHGRDLTRPGPRSGPPAIEWAKSLRLLLQVAAAWFDIGEGDRSAPILEEARESTGDTVERLMGNKPEARFAFISERAAFADGVDLDI